MTGEQKQTLKEFDAQQEKLERQLKALLEQIGGCNGKA